MARLNLFVQRFCVRAAEGAGWLYDIKSDVVGSYLSKNPEEETAQSALFNFPRLSFAAVVLVANASLLLLLVLPQTSLGELLASRQRDAVALYENIVRVQGSVESRPDALAPDARRPLVVARLTLLDLLSQLEEVRTKQPPQSERDHPVALDRLESIRNTLHLGIVAPSRGGAQPSDSLAAAYEASRNSISKIRTNLADAKSTLAHLPRADYAYAEQIGRRTISREQLTSRSPEFPPLNLVAEARLPEDYRGWKGFVSPEGRPFDPAEVIEGNSLRSIAGGIIMASPSTPNVRRDFSSFILSYDMEKQRLALIGPNSEIYYSDSIDPQTLRALNSFVAKGQSIAASIGWGGRIEDQDGGSTVLLDPTFVDTKAGQDLVRADSIPWEFSRRNLSGWHNPFASQFKATYDRFLESRYSELNNFLGNRPLSSDALRRLIPEAASVRSLSALITDCSIEPERLQFMILVLRKEHPKLSTAEVARVLDLKFLPHTTLATLYDKSPSFSLEPGKLLLQSGLEYRYVTSKVDYGDKIRFGKCLEGEDVRKLDGLDRLVNAHVTNIEEAFPSVHSVRQYGAIAAFLRWARKPGHLQAVDFYSLLEIAAHDVTSTPTPDRVE